MTEETKALLILLRNAGMVCELDELGYIDCSFECFEISVTRRPHYCDRGRWQVLASSRNSVRSTIDWADGFPRYYFIAECLVSELAAWKKARLKNLKPARTAEMAR